MFTPPFRSCFLFGLLGLLLASLASAQSVRWEPADGSLALRQTSELSLIFEDCEPGPNISLPALPGLSIGQPNRGEQSSFQIVNGQASRRKTVYLTYPVRPTEKQRVVIPSFEIATDKGPIRVASVAFDVGEATVGNSSVPLENAANSEIVIGSGAPLWAGQVVPVTYTLSVDSRFPAQIVAPPQWNSAPLVHETWGQPEPFNSVVNGEPRSNVLYRTQGYISQPGSFNLPSIEQLINLRVPSAGFSVFQQFQAEQYTISSAPPAVTVRPLPTAAPATFKGAVGSFQLQSQVGPEKPTVGEPVTWTLTLSGTGNWPDIPGLPPREVSKDFRVVQPQAKRTPVEGKLFEAHLAEDVVLIPTRPGTYRIGPVVWSYFDPPSGTYRTITTEPVTLEVAPAPNLPPLSASGSNPPSFGIPNPDDSLLIQSTIRATPAPDAPSRLLRDPLPGESTALAPWSMRAFGTSLAILLSLWIPCWLGLAARRAWLADPGRAARQARRRLADTIAALAGDPSPAERTRLIITWQRDSGILWCRPHALPGASAFAAVPTWPTLWHEADSFLYRAEGKLPVDWPARADTALRQRRAPRFPVFSTLRWRNLFPALAVISLLGLFAPFPTAAAEAPSRPATEAYAAGDFAPASQTWQARVNAVPTDWRAHHNLSLALAQQKQWAAAAAHATVAFVQNPADPATRWNFSHTLDRAGFTPAFLGAFTQPEWRHRLAQCASPAQWQRLALAAAFVLALAIAGNIAHSYLHGPRYVAWLCRAFGILALVIGVAVGLALPLYGPAQYRDAVLIAQSVQLRSVPTDVAAEQETTSLSAGSLARIDRAFLGWRRLVFANGQTGWVRLEDLTPLWDAK